VVDNELKEALLDTNRTFIACIFVQVTECHKYFRCFPQSLQVKVGKMPSDRSQLRSATSFSTHYS